MTDATRRVEQVARDCYGRLLAQLAVATRDLAACEDALAEAFLAALRTWETRGIPERPDAWLRTVARNRLLDGHKHQRVRNAAEETLMLMHEDAEAARGLDDERIRLLFACAHPAIDPSVRTPLMLQVVLGLSADGVASAFLLPAAGMAKRLVRAKAKIKRAGIPFELPEPDEWRPRLAAVLDAIYAAYGRSWDLSVALDEDVAELRREAVLLAEVVVQAVPEEPEPSALLALMLYAEGRRPARLDEDGTFVPLDEQDVSRWDAEAIERAESLLRSATAHATFERYQLEAAISSAHVARVRDGIDNAAQLALLYRTLVDTAPSLGAWLGLCAATARTRGPDAGLAALKKAEHPAVRTAQPYWALRAELHRRAGHPEQARVAFEHALSLTVDPAVRRWLQQRR